LLEILDVASGTFDIPTANPPPAKLEIGVMGFVGTQSVMATRWRSASASSVNTSYTADQQAASVAGGDPLILFQPLTFVPEPAGLGVLALAAACSRRQIRRRRRPSIR
jgi:MYXO-CTERM domain-containing protein